MSRQQDAIAYLRREVAKWRRVSERDTWNASDEEVNRLMSGHGLWDDPPPNYSKKDLIKWFQGYLHAESTQLGNAAEAVWFALLTLDSEDKSEVREWDLNKRYTRTILQDYGFLLQRLLDDYVFDTGTRHTVAIDASPLMTRATIQFLMNDPFASGMSQFVEEKIREGYQVFRAREGAGVVMLRVLEEAIEESPGISVQMDQVLTIAWPSIAHFWSNVQAWEDSDNIICQILTSAQELD